MWVEDSKWSFQLHRPAGCVGLRSTRHPLKVWPSWGAGPDVNSAVVWNLEVVNIFGTFLGPNKRGEVSRNCIVFSRIVWMGFIRCLVPLVACVCVCVIDLLLVSCSAFFVTYATIRFALTMISACSTKQSAIVWIIFGNIQLLQFFILWLCSRMTSCSSHACTISWQDLFLRPSFPDCTGCSGKHVCRMFWRISSIILCLVHPYCMHADACLFWIDSFDSWRMSIGTIWHLFFR